MDKDNQNKKQPKLFTQKSKTPQQPILIAMKGHPGTGKSTLAKSISQTLHFPLLDKDDIRDATCHLLPPTISSTLLNDLSYDALWRVASTQISLGLSVIVDSPLSRRSHLDSAIRSAGGARRVVVVECRASDEAEWRRRVEKRGVEMVDGGDGRSGLHKPMTWRDLVRLVDGYNGCTEYEMSDVDKIVVDTTRGDCFDEVLSSVLEFIESYRSRLHHSS